MPEWDTDFPEVLIREMAEKVSRLVKDNSLRSEMSGRAAGEFDASFSEERMIRDLEKLYDKLTGLEADRADGETERDRETNNKSSKSMAQSGMR